MWIVIYDISEYVNGIELHIATSIRERHEEIQHLDKAYLYFCILYFIHTKVRTLGYQERLKAYMASKLYDPDCACTTIDPHSPDPNIAGLGVRIKSAFQSPLLTYGRLL